jgi:hypothetical protein
MAQLNQYNVNDISHGVNGFGAPFCNVIYTAALAAATDTTLTVPSISSIGNFPSTSEAKILAVFTYAPGASVWVANGVTAAVPAGAAFAASLSELNPPAKQVHAGDILHFISAAIANVSVAFYALG